MENQQIIGIIGTGSGTGVTHFAIMTAGYYHGILGKRCALLEWNSHEDFSRLHRICSRRELDRSGAFRLLGTDYYGKAGTDALLLCKRSGYHTVIVDYGTVSEGNLREFLRCDRQFVVGSVCEWQIGAFLEFAGDRKRGKKSWELFTVFGSEEARKNMEKNLGSPIWRIPVSVDALEITGQLIQFYQQIL